MPRDPLGERWPEVYRDSPEVFDRFSRAEDPRGVLPPAFARLAQLEGAGVLELGCGTGRWTRELAPLAATYVATEPNLGMLRLALAAGAHGACWARAGGQALPLPDESFDRVIAAWVFANLRPKVREQVIGEAQRVVRASGEIWLLENHWDDDFQALRRDAGLEVTVEVDPLIESHGFELIEVLESEMRFESEDDARVVLGQILGPRVDRFLQERPQETFTHRVCALRKR